MQHFDYYNPTHICFGENRIKNIEHLVPSNSNVLVLFGGNSAKNTGTLDEVISALSKNKVTLFGGVEANPTYEKMMEAVEIVRENNIDFMIAVGGGSVIDGTKFVSAAALYPNDPWEILTTGGKHIGKTVPFGTVLTLPATGSEMNSGSVITHTAKQSKLSFMHRAVFPQFSILDPTKTYTLPKKQLSNGIADAFVHIMEQYLTHPTNAMVQDRYAESLLLSLIELAPKVLSESNDYQSRANFMWVATQALNGLIGAGVPQDWATHVIGHELTALYDIDHARTLAIVLPALLSVQKHHKQDKLVQYAKRVWNITEGSDDEIAQQAIKQTIKFFHSLDIPTQLSDYKLERKDIKTIVNQLEKHGMTSLGEHGDIDLQTSQKILEQAL